MYHCKYGRGDPTHNCNNCGFCGTPECHDHTPVNKCIPCAPKEGVKPIPPCTSPWDMVKQLTCKQHALELQVQDLTKRHGKLDQLHHKLVDDGAYYSPCNEVIREEGYATEDGTKYTLVRIKHNDCKGNRIKPQLHLAYGNTTNSQLKEDSFEASEFELADKMWSAAPTGFGEIYIEDPEKPPSVNYETNGWFGHVIVNGCPIETNEAPNLYTVGFTCSGKMKWYANNASDIPMLRRDRIENSIGCSGVIVIDKQVSSAQYRSQIPHANEKKSRVMMGQNYETKDIYILVCGNYDTQGMLTTTGAEILRKYCDVAVELCEGKDSVALDKGTLMFMPDDALIPRINAFWFISRKCEIKKKSIFDLALLTQKLGRVIWQSILNKNAILDLIDRVDGHDEDIAIIYHEIAVIKDRLDQIEADIVNIFSLIDLLTQRVVVLEGKVSVLEGKVSTLESEMVAAKDRLTSLEADNIKNQNDIALIKLNISKIETDIININTLISQLQGEISVINATMLDHETRIAALEACCSSFKEMIPVMESRITALEERATAIESDIQLINGEIADLQAQVTENTANITKNTADINSLNADLGVVRSDLTTLTATVTDLNAKLLLDNVGDDGYTKIYVDMGINYNPNYTGLTPADKLNSLERIFELYPSSVYHRIHLDLTSALSDSNTALIGKFTDAKITVNSGARLELETLSNSKLHFYLNATTMFPIGIPDINNCDIIFENWNFESPNDARNSFQIVTNSNITFKTCIIRGINSAQLFNNMVTGSRITFTNTEFKAPMSTAALFKQYSHGNHVSVFGLGWPDSNNLWKVCPNPAFNTENTVIEVTP